MVYENEETGLYFNEHGKGGRWGNLNAKKNNLFGIK
jgi:hypothetical protein